MILYFLISIFQTTYPYVSTSLELTLYSDSYENIFAIRNFLLELENTSYNLKHSFPVIQSFIKASDDNYFTVDLGRYTPFWTAQSKLDFSIEYLRHFYYFAKNHNLFIQFYIPKIPPSENAVDFLFYTTYSHLLIPIKIWKSTGKIDLPSLVKYLLRTLNISSNTYTEILLKMHCTKYNLYSELRNIFDQNELYHNIYNNHMWSENSLLLQLFSNIYNIKLIIGKKYFTTLEYNRKVFSLKYLFTIMRKNTYYLIFISKYDNNNFAIFCKIGKYFYGINEMAIDISYIIKSLLFSIYALIITPEKVTYENIPGISFSLKLTRELGVEYFFFPNDYSMVVSNMILYKK